MLFRRHSILQKLIIPILTLTVLQTVVFLAVIIVNDTIGRLDMNAYSHLNSYVSIHGRELEQTMVEKWANLDYYQDTILASRQLYAAYQEAQESDGVQDFKINRDVADNLLLMLRNSYANDAFVIFDQDVVNGTSYPALYFRDMDPSTASATNEDILVEYGSADLTIEMGLALDSYWSPRIFLDDSAAFFTKPLKAARENVGMAIENLGYWSEPFSLSEDANRKVITFTVPLLDEKGNAFGVIGTAVSVDYLYTMFPYRDLSPAESGGGYVLALDNGDGTIEPLVESGPVYKWILNHTEPIGLEMVNAEYGIYSLDFGSAYQIETVGSASYLRLYPNNAPFAEQKWVFMGIAAQDDLLSASNQLQTSLFLGFVITLFLGLAGTLLTAVMLSKPIRRLAKEVAFVPRERQILLPKIGIAEIDELSQTIETISTDVVAFSSRLSQIIEASDIFIGAVEYRIQEKKVYCYGKVAELLHLPPEVKDVNVFTDEEFDRITGYFKSITQVYEDIRIEKTPAGERSAKILEVTDENGVLSWLSIKIIKDVNEYLIVFMDTTDTIRERRRIEFERDYDMLTKLFNRRSFKRIVIHRLMQEVDTVGAMIMWDLDTLKFVNDTYGHDYGDRYIAQCAQVFSSMEDYGGVVSRMSGDEFLVALVGFHTKDEIRKIVHETHQRLLKTDFYLPEDRKMPLSASGGIAWYPDDGATYDELARYADYAMYEAKRTNRGTICEFSPEMFKRDEVLFSGLERLNQFFEQKLVNFVFQPIVSVRTGDVFAYEALMRPYPETKLTIEDVLKLAHTQSRYYQLEKMTWMGVLEQYHANRTDFGEAKIFINSIPNTILKDEDCKELRDLYSEELSHIVLEIIESEQTDPDCVDVKLQEIALWGGQVALDDFGAGYNNEITLLALNPQYIKLDMALVRNVDTDAARQKMIATIVEYAQNRHIYSIAEGVETEEELRILVAIGVDYIQGFFLATPQLEPYDIPAEKKKLLRGIYKDCHAGQGH